MYLPNRRTTQNGCKTISQSPNSLHTNPKGGNRPFLASRNNEPNQWTAKKECKTTSQSPNSLHMNPKGGTDPCASFWPIHTKSMLLSYESKNRQKRMQNNLAEPKPASYQAEGGKPTLAHLSGQCLQFIFFCQPNENH